VWKWVADAEEWMFQWVDFQSYSHRGLSVADDGVYAMCTNSSGAVPGPTPNPQRNLTIGGEKIDVPNPGDNELFARIVITSSPDGFWGVASSPSGIVIAKRYDDSIVEVTPTGDYTLPTVTVRVTVADMVCDGSAAPTQAIAINDDEIYCYSMDRTPAGVSHQIRAADNSLIMEADHGGYIYDCVVLPDGKVIVAGERVAR
jgi:hypothetical protein